MRTILTPAKSEWESLCRRPVMEKDNLNEIVTGIIKSVVYQNDAALYSFSERFDGVKLNDLKVTASEINNASSLIPEELKNAIKTAKENIDKFHSAQLKKEPVVETTSGVRCWRKSIPIEKVGLYIPGGTAPLFSTLLMLGIPARIAGCREIIICSPPSKDGDINPIILYTASIIGITDIFKVGGAQAIAAMANGTETIPKVYKIFGPGNQYVTKAKELVQLDGVSIDMPAGPSEVLVIADKYANPAFIAADLLSQAEHGTDSQVILLTDNQDIIDKVKRETENQLQVLPRKEIAALSLENSCIIMLDSLEKCIDFSNLYAPEHLIINTQNPNLLAEKVINAGSVFLGSFSCESAGDYASGTNHTLPTNGYARNYSGVSTESFMKKVTFQEISREGIMNLGPAIELMAKAELLEGHKNAVSIRLKSLKND